MQARRWLQPVAVLARCGRADTSAAAKAPPPQVPVNELCEAFSGVPLHIWWSTRDRIVVDGTWAHSAEMHATARLPVALVKLKLITLDEPLPASAKP